MKWYDDNLKTGIDESNLVHLNIYSFNACELYSLSSTTNGKYLIKYCYVSFCFKISGNPVLN